MEAQGAERSLSITPPSSRDQTVRRSRSIRLGALQSRWINTRPAPTYETHLFQRLSGRRARAHARTTCWQRSLKRGGISISKPVGSATETSSQGRSIIIRGVERSGRRRRGESAVSEGGAKLGPRVIHLRPLALLAHPDSRRSSSTSAPLFSPPLHSTFFSRGASLK